jgi:hypothetical protein
VVAAMKDALLMIAFYIALFAVTVTALQWIIEA